jgi:hypothetical protein
MRIPITDREVHLITAALLDEASRQAELLVKMKCYDTIPDEMKELLKKLLDFQQKFRAAGKSDNALFLVND